VSSTGEEVFFKIKRNTKLTKLQGAYASKVGKDVGSIRSVFLFFLKKFKFSFPLWHKEDPCARDLLLDGSKTHFYDISITHYFFFPFTLDFCTMELGYKMTTPQHHLIWRTMVCSMSCFMFFESLMTHTSSNRHYRCHGRA
jgi:hypothetical protein